MQAFAFSCLLTTKGTKDTKGEVPRVRLQTPRLCDIIDGMALLRDRCICLRKTEYSETSQILVLLSREHGLVRVIAKGAHRRTKAGAGKFDGGIDFLDLGEAVFTDSEARDLNTLTDWKLQNGHQHLRKDLRGIYLGLYGAEVLSLVIEERDPHPELFDRFAAVLSALGGKSNEEVFLVFELDVLQETGHLPELSSCVACRQPINDREAMFFSISRGGLICQACSPSVPDRQSIDHRLLRLLQSLLRLPRDGGVPQRLPRLTRHQTDPINRLLARYIQHQVGRGLKSAKYILLNPQSTAGTL